MNSDEQQIENMIGILPPEFEPIERIGEGGHGEVYKARFKMLDRTVAVKVLKSDGSDDMRKQVERIQKEAKALAKLNHQNIVKIFQVGICTNGSPFLVCEYLEGRALDKVLQETTSLGSENILAIFQQILGALQFAHENNLLHRDIKPSNIMLLEDSESKTITAKLLDFGIAREIELPSDSSPGLTGTSMLSGSPAYMSPEQCQGKTLERRSDLYSVACVLYECLYGTTPFTGESELAIQYKQIHDSVDALEPIKREQNSNLRKLLTKALAKEPTQRHNNAEQFQQDLAQSLKATSKLAKSEREFSLVLPVLLILLALGGIFVWNLKQGTRPTTESKQLISTIDPPHKSGLKLENRRSNDGKLNALAKRYDEIVTRQLHSYNEQAPLTELLADLQRVIVVIPNSEANRGLRFVALFMNAQIQRALNRPSEDLRQAYQKALDCCSSSKGTYIESIYCQAWLADILQRENNFAEEEKLLKKIEVVRKKIGDVDQNYLRFDIPDSLEKSVSNSCRVEDLSRRLGLNAYNQKRYESALQYLDKYIDELSATGNCTSASTPAVVWKAQTLVSLGRKAEATELLRKQLRPLCKDLTDTPHRQFWQEIAFLNLARAQYANDALDDCRNTLAAAKEVINKRQHQDLRAFDELEKASRSLTHGKYFQDWEGERDQTVLRWNH